MEESWKGGVKIKKGFIWLSSLIVCALFFISGCLEGEPVIDVRGATFVPSPMMKGAAASFMFIVNDGKGDDALLSCSVSEYPDIRCELHGVIKGKMRKVESIVVPAKKTTELKGGSYHLMLFDVPEDLKDGATLLLKFEKSGLFEVKANFRNG